MSRTTRFALITLTGVLVACGDSTPPPRPAAVVFVSPPPASIPAGTAVPSVTVAVKDEKGNALSGQPLTITVNGGSLVGAPTSTQGSATSIGTWTIAGKTGTNTLTIVSGSLPPLTVTVQGVVGPAAKVTATVGAANVVGKSISVPLAALDAFDNPVAGATIQLTVSGGGTLSAASVVTDASGAATAQWTLGTTRGPNTLTATAGSAIASFTTVAQADVPASLKVSDGDGQTANAGAPVPVPPRVTVTDRFGNATPGQSVTFAVTAGGGSLNGAATVTTDTNGVAIGPAWVLGRRNVPQQLSVTVAGLAQTLSATIQTNFSLVLRFVGTTTDAQKAIFQGAAARVTAAITQGGAPITAIGFSLADECGLTGLAPITETIQGIIIYAGIDSIDGPGKILAESGPCAFRGATSLFMPAVAAMVFDVADLASLTTGGSLEDVATHEMFHALGFGVTWTSLALITGSVNVDPRYVGSNGITGCGIIATPDICLPSVPLENTGGDGTAGAHWRESVFHNELMTGFLNGGVNPLSVMSIASMIDLGYQVSMTAADPFSLKTSLRAPLTQQVPGAAWERLRFPAGPLDLEPAGGSLLRRKKASNPP